MGGILTQNTPIFCVTMPPTVDEVHVHFVETKENYVDEKGNSKVRTKVKCNHCDKFFVLRNVQQLICHLAAPSSGMGKDSACPSVSPVVRQHYVERLAIYEKEKARVSTENLQVEAKKKAKIQSGISEAFAASSVFPFLVKYEVSRLKS